MDDKMNMLKETLGEDGLNRLAGLSAKCFFIKKEDLEKQSGQPLINEDGILVADKSHFIPVNLTSDTTIQAEEPRRSFKCSFTLVGEAQKRYYAQMLAVTVLPVFSKSMLPITLPHTPFQLRDSYTKLYRNPHNFFYSSMGNIYSPFLRKESEEEEQLFEKLETALKLCNLRSLRFRSQLFHPWL